MFDIAHWQAATLDNINLAPSLQPGQQVVNEENSDIIDTVIKKGINLTNEKMGFYDGAVWRAVISADGTFNFRNQTNSAYFSFDGTNFEFDGKIHGRHGTTISDADFDANPNFTTGFRIKAGAQGTTADPNIFGAYIKGSTIEADGFSIVDKVSGNKVQMNGNGLYFKKADNTILKYVQRTNVFRNHSNNTPITLLNVQSTPEILMSPATMPVFKTSYLNQDQTFQFNIVNVDDKINTDGTYTFTPRAQLQLSSNIFNDDMTGEFIDQTASTKYSAAYQTTTALSQFTGNFTIQSIRPSGTANVYYYRKCTVTLETSSDGVNFTTKGSPLVKTFGATTSSITDSITYTGTIGVNAYIRMKFVYADVDGTTFTTGATGYYDYKSVSTTLQSNFTVSGTSWDIGSSTCSGSGDSGKSYSATRLNVSTGANTFSGACNYSNSANWVSGTATYYGNTNATNSEIFAAQYPGYEITSSSSTIASSSGAIGGTLLVSDNRARYSQAIGSFSRTATGNGSFQATISVNVTGRKWIPYTSGTNIQNSGTGFSMTATASAALVLAEGTLNILVVE